MPRTLVTNAVLATLEPGPVAYGLVPQGAIVVNDGRIEWCGAEADLPSIDADRRWDAGGRLVTPALIDCHTHLVFGGNRAREFELRLAGASYEQIAREGGGINATVAATRA